MPPQPALRDRALDAGAVFVNRHGVRTPIGPVTCIHFASKGAGFGAYLQFLTSMDPEVIRRIKSAAALRDTTASSVLEDAAKEWLERHQDAKK